MNAKLKRIQSDCDYEGKWPYPPEYEKSAMYKDLKYLLSRCEELEKDNKRLKAQNEKLAENLSRFWAEPEQVFARPGSEDEIKILEVNDAKNRV